MHTYSIRIAGALMVVALLATGSAQASGHVFTASNAKWKIECNACHIAYSPKLLPAESWKVLMFGLDKHFGSDASIDPITTSEIAAFLQANAGGYRSETSGKPNLRVTDSRWFKREHSEVSETTWKSPKVKSASNCSACHTQAENGDFSERSLRLPK